MAEQNILKIISDGKVDRDQLNKETMRKLEYKCKD